MLITKIYSPITKVVSIMRRIGSQKIVFILSISYIEFKTDSALTQRGEKYVIFQKLAFLSLLNMKTCIDTKTQAHLYRQKASHHFLATEILNGED